MKSMKWMSITFASIIVLFGTSSWAESLFQAGIQYQAQSAYTPRSLYAQPRPGRVGDLITINIDETTTNDVTNNTTLNNKQDLTENSTSMLSRIIQSVTGLRGIIPSLNGLSNEKKTSITAKTKRNFTYQDKITCQVVQILPNGSLMIQGKKLLGGNTEKQILYVSGIVNPYYLDTDNQIDSTKVANLQLETVGRGNLSNEQHQSFINRLFRYVN